jgi:hypothetical protein
MRTGRAVATGITTGALNRVTPSCATSTAPDRSFSWTAPMAGDYFFDTFGSSYDTMLVIQSTCAGPELACNDDIPGMGQDSRVRVTLGAGQRIIVVVDGWGSSSGAFILNITRATANEIGFCTDGLDNDGDFGVDCGDADCAMDPGCLP